MTRNRLQRSRGFMRRHASGLPGLRLADPESDHAPTVTDHDERAEAEVLAAFDDLRDAVDGHNGVLDVELTRIDSLASSHFYSGVSSPILSASQGPIAPLRPKTPG